jgi:dipeptidyl aminopeptidase/acylaminoacyl peptidase
VTPFDDLQAYLGLPRVGELRLSPHGTWLAATVHSLSADRRKFVPSIWRIPATPAVSNAPDGSDAPEQPGAGQPGGAVRLTRSAAGEDGAAFLPDGSLLFMSRRTAPASTPPDAEATDADAPTALWLLPATGGEAQRVAAPPGGISQVATATGCALVALTSALLPGSTGAADDEARRKARKDAGVSAILHESGPVRHWDHDLGPDALRVLLTGVAGAEEPRDLTGAPGRALDEHHLELAPDGGKVVTGWSVFEGNGARREEVAVIDCASGERTALLAAAGHDFNDPRISPDGSSVVAIRERHETYDSPGDVTLVVTKLDSSGSPEDLLPGFDRWPHSAAWAPDSGSVFFTADDGGRCPVFRVDLATGVVTRLTEDHGAYSSLCPAPGGRFLYALRSAVDSPPAAVRLDLTSPGSMPARLAGPAAEPVLPGRLAEVQAQASDGALIRGWLVLPGAAAGVAPAPLLLWVHGGPLSSWNSWSWRWNPWLAAARGYAVLLPDPALSTGYGLDFIARGHAAWGARPFDDLMAITDAVVARPDIDVGRTAAMGGSFGGYMANWIAGHTDRFRAIVTHASLWALDQMFGTTDSPALWWRHFGTPASHPERYAANSPHLHAGQIATPMLIIHGDKDYRVPIGEALRLWSDLGGRPGNLAGTKFLYFPDENHWVLTPGNAAIWYETVFAFLAQHVLGQPWRRPELL